MSFFRIPLLLLGAFFLLQPLGAQDPRFFSQLHPDSLPGDPNYLICLELTGEPPLGYEHTVEGFAQGPLRSIRPDSLLFSQLLSLSDSAYEAACVEFPSAAYPGADTFRIIATGDIMLGTDYPVASYLPPEGDCSPLLSPVHHVLQSGDLLFGNLEGGFGSDSSGGIPKRCKDTTNCYVFRMPEHFVDCFVGAGFDLLSVANNHVNDFGPVGRANTARLLDNTDIAYAGFVTHPWTLYEKDGLIYGFAAFAPNRGCMDMKDYRNAARITALLDSIADIVIISFHGGAEGSKHQHVVRGDEVYLGYNRGSVYRFAHEVIDAGADVVFGHGPHVTRALELYKDRLICYSLGNFATYRRFNLRGPNGLAPIVRARVDVTGRFIDGDVVATYQPGQGGARIDPHGRVIPLLKRLTEEDFPGQDLVIGLDGSLGRK